MDKKIQVLPNSQNKINQENKKRRGSYQNGITCINSVWSSPDFIFKNNKKEVKRMKKEKESSLIIDRVIMWILFIAILIGISLVIAVLINFIKWIDFIKTL